MFLLSESILLPVFFVLIVVLVVSLSYYFSSKQKVIRTLSKLPMKRIGSLKTNEFSKITGIALPIKDPLIAPYSKRKCVFYSIKIEQKKKTGKSASWRTLINEEKIQDFFVDKRGDFVIIKPTQNPKNYKSYLVIDERKSSTAFNDASPKFEELLKQYNIKSTVFFGLNKHLRIKEGIIEIGEQVTVAGVVKWESLKEPIKGYNYSKIAALESTANQKLIITDLPNIKSKKRM